MNVRLFLIALVGWVSIGTAEAQNAISLDRLLDQGDPFALQRSDKTSFSPTERRVIEAYLANAFHRVDESAQAIDRLLHEPQLDDSIRSILYTLQIDNHIKRYRYDLAAQAIEKLLTQYVHCLDSSTVADYRNTYRLWSALSDVPVQRVEVGPGNEIPLTTDRAGLHTLPVAANDTTFGFIFDTGANLSTVTRSVAQALGMLLIETQIQVGTVTGQQVAMQFAVCPRLTIGHVTVHHAVFLVIDDAQLTFPEQNYRIYGIIGFPIIEAMGEVHIGRNGTFAVPSTPSEAKGSSNLALSGLTPLVAVDGLSFLFDTGADKTLLYAPYYQQHRARIDQHYTQDTVSFSGAGGLKKFAGFSVPFAGQIGDRAFELDSVQLLKEPMDRPVHRSAYGTIGQDVIRQFDTMILNFKQMFVRFE